MSETQAMSRKAAGEGRERICAIVNRQRGLERRTGRSPLQSAGSVSTLPASFFFCVAGSESRTAQSARARSSFHSRTNLSAADSQRGLRSSRPLRVLDLVDSARPWIATCEVLTELITRPWGTTAHRACHPRHPSFVRRMREPHPRSVRRARAQRSTSEISSTGWTRLISYV